jgi:hypothetical protein
LGATGYQSRFALKIDHIFDFADAS